MAGTGIALTVVFGLFALGAAIIAVAASAWGGAATRGLWPAYASTVLIVAAILVPAALHPSLFSLVVAVAAWRCTLELADLHGARMSLPASLASGAAAGAAAWLGAMASMDPLLLGGSALLVILLAPVYRQAIAGRLAGARRCAFALGLPLLAAAHLSHLAHRDDGFLWVFFLYVTVETQDSMAFLFGRLFGRRALLPRLSPRKTAEGAVAGAAIGTAAGAATAYALLGCTPLLSLALAAFVAACGFGGDLLTSALKRAAGAKDFRPVHALHGGILDIYDSTLIAAVPLSLVSSILLVGAAGTPATW